MKSKYKKYIIQNISKKSVKEIAENLRIKESEVSEFIKKRKLNADSSGSAPEVQKDNKKIAPWLYALSIVLLVVLVYANSINGKFLLDDEVFIIDNSFIKSWGHLAELFVSDIGKGGGKNFGYYRPMQAFAYLIIYNLWGLDVRPYHIVSIILHILVSLSVFYMVRLLYKDALFSFWVALLYAVYPAHVESVAYISGMGDCIAGLFILLSFIFYVKQLKAHSFAVPFLFFGCYSLALFTKETSLILLALFIFYHFVFREKVKFYPLIVMIILTLIYIMLRLYALKGSDAAMMSITEIIKRVPGFLAAINGYMKILFLPVNLHMGHDSRIFEFSDPQAIMGLIIILASLFLTVKSYKKNRLAFFAIGWFFITLLPASNLYAVAFYMADHYLYLPSIGFFLILASGLRAIYNKNFKLYSVVAVAILVAFYSYITFKQNDYWKDPVTFFERTLKYNPNSSRALNNLGRLHEEKAQLTKAKDLYEKAIACNPSHTEAYNNLGNVLFNMGKDKEAIVMYKKAIETKPDYAKAYNNIAKVYEQQGMDDEAVKMYAKALEINQNIMEIYFNLGNLYERTGQSDKAIAVYRKALDIDPVNDNAYIGLGNVLAKLGKIEDASILYKKAMEINPTNANAYNNLGNIRAMLGDSEGAIYLYKRAVEVKPDYALACYSLSLTYFQMEQYDLAIKYYDKAIKLGYKIDPNFSKLLEPFQKWGQTPSLSPGKDALK